MKEQDDGRSVGQGVEPGGARRNGQHPVCPEHGTSRVGARGPVVVERYCGSGPECSWGAVVRVGRRLRGFLARPEAALGPHKAKYPVVAALRRLGPLTTSQLVAETGLSRGSVAGVVQRGLKYHFLLRSEGLVELVPRGKGHLYGLSPRGEAYADWVEGVA